MTRIVSVNDIIASARYGELEELKREVSQSIGDEVTVLSKAGTLGNTALHMAAGNGHEDIVDYLLMYLLPGHINKRNDSGNTALHWCALNGHLTIAEKLVKAGATVMIKNDAGKTALYEAQQNGHEAVVDVLLLNVDTEMGEGQGDVESESFTE